MRSGHCQHLLDIVRSVVQAADDKPERITEKVTSTTLAAERTNLSKFTTEEKARASFLRTKAPNVVPGVEKIQPSPDA